MKKSKIKDKVNISKAALIEDITRINISLNFLCANKETIENDRKCIMALHEYLIHLRYNLIKCKEPII